MDNTLDLRNSVINSIRSADSKLLRMIQALVESYQEEGELILTEAQKFELDKRIERFERGETQFFTWEEIEGKLSRTQ